MRGPRAHDADSQSREPMTSRASSGVRALACVFLLWAFVPFAADGEPTDPTTADALFEAGRAAAKRGDFKEACEKFAESERLDPAPGTVFNLAECHNSLGEI